MAFVAGRQILDASLIANEIIDYWQTANKRGLVIKPDLEKMDFRFLSNANYSILINGKPRGKIIPTRGTRQFFSSQIYVH